MPDACQVHGSHRPGVVTVHHHHIQPEAMGGPTEPANLVTVCPTGHYNIHAAMAALVFGTPVPKVTREELRIATLGYQRWIDAGKPGNPHAAYGLPA